MTWRWRGQGVVPLALVVGALSWCVGVTGRAQAAPSEAAPAARLERVALELGLGFNALSESDDFVERARSFDFTSVHTYQMRSEIGLSFDLLPALAVRVGYARIDWAKLTRDGFDQAAGGSVATPEQSLRWRTGMLTASVRAQWPIEPWLRPYIQLGGGLAISRHVFDALELGSTPSTIEDAQVDLGPAFAADLGCQLMVVPVFGFYVATGLSYAPVLETLTGDARTPVIGHVTAGLRLAWSVEP